MQKRAIYCVFLISIFLANCQDRALVPPASDVDFTISKNILPGYFVTSIDFVDDVAWIGTFKQGIIKYSNESFDVFDRQNSLFPDNLVIHDIKTDDYENVWLGTEGLIKYDGNKFTRYKTTNSPILEDIVWSIEIDKNNKLWLATSRHNEGGLTTFDGSEWETFTPDNSPLPGNGVMDIAIDESDNIWLGINGTVNGSSLVKINGDDWTVITEEETGIPIYNLGNLAIGKRDKLISAIDYSLSSAGYCISGTNNTNQPNLITFDGSEWQVNNPVDEDGSSLGCVGVVNTDYAGNIWAGIDGDATLAVYNGEKWNHTDFDFGGITFIEIDPHDRIWIGTGNGIFIIAKK